MKGMMEEAEYETWWKILMKQTVSADPETTIDKFTKAEAPIGKLRHDKLGQLSEEIPFPDY